MDHKCYLGTLKSRCNQIVHLNALTLLRCHHAQSANKYRYSAHALNTALRFSPNLSCASLTTLSNFSGSLLRVRSRRKDPIAIVKSRFLGLPRRRARLILVILSSGNSSVAKRDASARRILEVKGSISEMHRCSAIVLPVRPEPPIPQFPPGSDILWKAALYRSTGSPIDISKSVLHRHPTLGTPHGASAMKARAATGCGTRVSVISLAAPDRILP